MKTFTNTLRLALMLVLLTSTACQRATPKFIPTALPDINGTEAPATATPPRAKQPTPTRTRLAAPPTRAPAEVKNAGKTIIAELTALAQVQDSPTEAWRPAKLGEVLSAQSAVQTDATGEIYLRTEEADSISIMRVAPNSMVSLDKTPAASGDFVVDFELFLGEVLVWVGLKTPDAVAGVNVSTPLGVASIRGSTFSVAYDPITNQFTVECFEATEDCVVTLPPSGVLVGSQEIHLANGTKALITVQGLVQLDTILERLNCRDIAETMAILRHVLSQTDLAEDINVALGETLSVTVGITLGDAFLATAFPSGTPSACPTVTPTPTTTPTPTATPIGFIPPVFLTPTPTRTPTPTATCVPTTLNPPCP